MKLQSLFRVRLKSLFNMTMLLGIGPIFDCVSCYQTVWVSGALAPDAGGSVFVQFGTPFINGTNDIVFHARLDDASSDDDGIWARVAGVTTLIARVGDVAPDTGGAQFATLHNAPAWNDGGHLAFYATLTGAGVNATNNKAIFAQDVGGGGSLRLVARSGDPAPDLAGEFFTDFWQEPLISDDGHVQITASITTNPSLLAGHWHESSGALKLLAAEEAPATVPAGATFASASRPAINDMGRAAFRAVLEVSGGVISTNNEGIWLDDAGVQSLLVREDDPVPGVPNAEFEFFGPTVRINNGGSVTFLATIRDDGSGTSGVTVDNNVGVWAGSSSGSIALVMRADGPFANLDGLRFGAPDLPALINDDGEVALKSELRGPGVNNGNDTALFSNATGVMRIVAREGDPAIDGPGTFAFFDVPTLNARGQTIFQAAVNDAGTVYDGLYLTSGCDDLCLVVREGAEVDVSTSGVPDLRTISDIRYRGGSGNSDGHRSVLGDFGDVVFGLDFTEGSSGIFTAESGGGECNAPANDRCDFPTPIAPGETLTGSTADATYDGVGSCGVANTAPGVWYSVIGTGSTLTASTCNNAEFDTRLSVFCGGCPVTQDLGSDCCEVGTLCNDPECVLEVCATDPFCCAVFWDDVCVEHAISSCGLSCFPDFDPIGASCVGGAGDLPGCAGGSEFSWCSLPGTEYLILVHGDTFDAGSFGLSLTEGSACSDASECVSPGACCQGDLCEEIDELACGARNGEFLGIGTTCADNPCEREHPGWNWVDVGIHLTANQPTYWSVATGEPATGGVSPFTILDPANPAAGALPGRPAADGSGDRVLRGFIAAWTVDGNGAEIRWNHLKGDAVVVNYERGAAWEYQAFAFQVVSANANGTVNPGPTGELQLDGVEYDNGFDLLLLDFYATGSNPFRLGDDRLETELTLLPLNLDLRQETEGSPTTKASFTIWNQNETKLTGLDRCVTCWDSTLLGQYGLPNHFLAGSLQTDKGKAQIEGLASQNCDVDFSPGDACTQMFGGPAPNCDPRDVVSTEESLLGVVVKHIAFSDTGPFESAGMNLVGMGVQSGVLRADIAGDPPPERPDTAVQGIAPTSVLRAENAAALPPQAPPITLAPTDRLSATEKGSLLIYAFVELRWNRAGDELIQDTFIDLTNDFPEDVQVQMYFVNGDPPTLDLN